MSGLSTTTTSMLKAAAAAGPVGSAVTAVAVFLDGQRNPSGGPLNFSGPGFVLFIALIALAVGTAFSGLCLSLTVWLFGVERLSGWRPAAASAVGAAAGALVAWLFFGFVAAAWKEPQFALLGGLYGALTAFFWTRWAPELGGDGER